MMKFFASLIYATREITVTKFIYRGVEVT